MSEQTEIDHTPYIEAVADALGAADGVEVSDWWAEENERREGVVMVHRGDVELCVAWDEEIGWSVSEVDENGETPDFDPAGLGLVPAPERVVEWVKAWPAQFGGDAPEETVSVDEQLAAYLPEARRGN